jgi:hypothetical protein
MTPTRIIAPSLLLALLAGATIADAQYYQGPPPQQPMYAQNWMAPPPEFAAAQQRGFHDGIEGAKRDYENHRPPNVNNRDEYRNPHFIAPPDRRDYRFGFARGYQVAVRHMYGPGPS